MMRVLRFALLAALALAACRHIPVPECRERCEDRFDACRAKNGMWWDCKEHQENCERACPSAP
jgi:hypothetical protein